MIFDVARRHQLAVTPSPLATISTTLTAMIEAIEDCRNAGVAPDSDPAVVLLARHMATISSNRAPRATLRAACERKLRDIARFPPLLSLAARGVEYDAIAKNRFHREARSALEAVAMAMNLGNRNYGITTNVGDPANSGCVSLDAPGFTIEVRVGGRHEHREVLYRSTTDRAKYGPSHHASIRALVDPTRFVLKLRKDLNLNQDNRHVAGDATHCDAHTLAQ